MRSLPTSWTSLLTRLGFKRTKRSTYSHAHCRRKLYFEQVEDRRMLAMFTVNDPGDFIDSNPNVTTLREAINAANALDGPDTIDFSTDPADGLNGATITLTGDQLIIVERVKIDASMLPAGITIQKGAGSPATAGLRFQDFDLNPTGIFGETGVFNLGICTNSCHSLALAA